MASLNKVFLMGNLTRDPELRYTTSGTGVCDLRLAVNRRYLVNGEEREEVCYVDVAVFGRQAETCNQYLRRGSQALVEGRLRFDEWDDRETGKKRNRLQVVAERVQFMSPPSGGGAHQQRQAPQQQSAPPQQQAPASQQSAPPQQAPAPQQQYAPAPQQAPPVAPQPQSAPPAVPPAQAAPPPPPFPGAGNQAQSGDAIDDIPF
jgi:single-strand DNA-binding protein